MKGACVNNVLDSMVDALLKNPDRKFVFAEQVILITTNFSLLS